MLPFLRLLAFGRGRLPGVVQSSLGVTRCEPWSCRGGRVCAGRLAAPQPKAPAEVGNESETAVVTTQATTRAVAHRLPQPAPRRGRTRGGIFLITCSDEV